MPQTPAAPADLTTLRLAGAPCCQAHALATPDALLLAWLALALRELEPLSEDAHRRVMRLHYLRAAGV